ncbi:MAG: hypothetical protein JWO03_1762 [Bacteroidetes bacterium]|nr:hypothetical protein [Bacteroidota bacterium]
MAEYFFYIVFLILALPILVASLIYWWLSRKGYRFWGLFICLSIIGSEFFAVYTALYPLDSFYKEDFEFCTKLKFPESGKIIAKDATYPDFHGEYSSDAVVSISESDFYSLLNKVNADTFFRTDTIMGWRSEHYKKVTAGIETRDILRIATRGQATIGFLKDKKRIIFERGPY